jgi:hypothetical protein
MAKTQDTEKELEAILLGELQKYPRCEAARSVSLCRLDPKRDVTWGVFMFNPGRADPQNCRLALKEIELRLQNVYDLVPEG